MCTIAVILYSVKSNPLIINNPARPPRSARQEGGPDPWNVYPACGSFPRGMHAVLDVDNPVPDRQTPGACLEVGDIGLDVALFLNPESQVLHIPALETVFVWAGPVVFYRLDCPCQAPWATAQAQVRGERTVMVATDCHVSHA